MEKKDFNPRHIYWSTVSIVMFFALLGVAMVIGGLWGLYSAVQSLPWPG